MEEEKIIDVIFEEVLEIKNEYKNENEEIIKYKQEVIG